MRREALVRFSAPLLCWHPETILSCCHAVMLCRRRGGQGLSVRTGTLVFADEGAAATCYVGNSRTLTVMGLRQACRKSQLTGGVLLIVAPKVSDVSASVYRLHVCLHCDGGFIAIAFSHSSQVICALKRSLAPSTEPTRCSLLVVLTQMCQIPRSCTPTHLHLAVGSGKPACRSSCLFSSLSYKPRAFVSPLLPTQVALCDETKCLRLSSAPHPNHPL